MFRTHFENLDRTYVETIPACARIGKGNVTETEIKKANDFWAEEFRKAAEEALKEPLLGLFPFARDLLRI